MKICSAVLLCIISQVLSLVVTDHKQHLAQKPIQIPQHNAKSRMVSLQRTQLSRNIPKNNVIVNSQFKVKKIEPSAIDYVLENKKPGQILDSQLKVKKSNSDLFTYYGPDREFSAQLYPGPKQAYRGELWDYFEPPRVNVLGNVVPHVQVLDYIEAPRENPTSKQPQQVEVWDYFEQPRLRPGVIPEVQVWDYFEQSQQIMRSNSHRPAQPKGTKRPPIDPGADLGKKPTGKSRAYFHDGVKAIFDKGYKVPLSTNPIVDEFREITPVYYYRPGNLKGSLRLGSSKSLNQPSFSGWVKMLSIKRNSTCD